MWKLGLLSLVLLLSGCANATFKSPVTGNTISCSGIAPDINLWSSYQLCMESAVTEGYQRVE